MARRSAHAARPVDVEQTRPRSDPAFADAVRHALKDLSRPDRLATSTLLSTSLAATGPELREALTAVIESLQSHPRDRKLFRALDRTYLHPAPTQELAAELLGLPFSTYRRHLTDGVKRVVAVLWAVSK